MHTIKHSQSAAAKKSIVLRDVGINFAIMRYTTYTKHAVHMKEQLKRSTIVQALSSRDNAFG